MTALLRTFVVLALSVLAVAVPAPINTPGLLKPTLIGATVRYCGMTRYTVKQVEVAAETAIDHIYKGLQVGSRKYPHEFRNQRKQFIFPASCKAPFYEFPIVKGEFYTGDKPGPDRVVIGSLNGMTATFCGVVSHNNALSYNGFLQCSSTKAYR